MMAAISGKALSAAALGLVCALATAGCERRRLAGADADGVKDLREAGAPSTLTWTVSASGKDLDQGFDIALDRAGNCLVTGWFTNRARFGTFTLEAKERSDLFVAKVDPEGAFRWAVSAASPRDIVGRAVAVDGGGNSYITGNFEDSATFGSITLTSRGNADVFVAKLDPDGAFLWVISAGAGWLDTGRDIAVDSAGNSHVAGSFWNQARFGSANLVSVGGDDMFLAKVSPQGKFLWAVSAGGIFPETGSGVDIDAAGNSYVVGSLNGTASFGATTLSSSGGFVAKVDPGGTFRWATPFNTPALFQEDFHIAADSAGNSTITGFFTGTGQFGAAAITSAGLSDVFVARLSPKGAFQWAVRAGGVGSDGGGGLVMDSAGNAHVTGWFSGTARFGATTLSSAGLLDIFTARLGSGGGFSWARGAGGPSSDKGAGIAVDSEGSSFITGYFHVKALFGAAALVSGGNTDVFIAKMDSNGKF